MSDERWEVVCANGTRREWSFRGSESEAARIAADLNRSSLVPCGPHTVRKVEG